MLHKAKFAVLSEISTVDILCGQNVELLNVELVGKSSNE